MSNILIAFDHKENSRLLYDYLSQYHTLFSLDANNALKNPFDLAIFDGHALNRMWQQVNRLKEANRPLFIAVLLVTPRQEISLITRQLWRIIDDIIVTPIDKPELLVRVEVLLRTRRLSLELQAKNLQLEREMVIRQETEQALRESEERFQVALKNSPLFVAHTDADLKYTWTYNVDAVGGAGDILGKGDHDLLPAEAAATLAELKREVLENGVGTRAEIALNGDQTRFYDVTIEPLLNAQEAVVGTTLAALDITARKQAEEKSREISALQERQRLARDLHDSVNQSLFTINLIADSLPQLGAKNPDRMWQQVDELRRLTRFAMAEMRTLLLDLRPASVIKTSLADLITQLIRSVQARREINLTSEVVVEQAVPEDVHIALYRITQEALNNISKHSNATQGRITLTVGANGLQLRIWDNGSGFDTSQSASGMGLGVMRERATFMGAAFEVVSSPDVGTEIVVSAPGLSSSV